MASLIDELIDVLDGEEKEYQDLILLSHEKTPVIVKGDLEKLKTITEAEQYVIGRLNRLEKKRTEVIKDIALVLGMNEETIKVTDIAKMLESRPEELKRLLDSHNRLRTALENMATVNDLNKKLVNDSLEFINYNLNLVKAVYQEPATGNYTKNAYSAAEIGGVGVFDAKQ